MSNSSNLKLVHLYFDDVLRDGEHDLLDDIIHEAYFPSRIIPDENTETNELIEELKKITGTERIKTRIRLLSEQFGNFNFEMMDIVETNETVIVHYKVTTTHLGAWNDIPATGAKISTSGFHLFKFRDNKIFSITAMLRMNDILLQLGKSINNKKNLHDYIEYLGKLMNL